MNGRSFEFELTEEYKKLFAPLVSLLSENKDKYFVSFRTQPNRMSIYYKRQLLVAIEYVDGDWYVSPRSISSTESDRRIMKVNKKYLNSLSDNGFQFEKKKIEEGFDLLKLFEISKVWIDDYCDGKESETTIQNDIACAYSNVKDNLLCVDMEYILSKDMLKGNDIPGRYDFVFLKMNDDKYEIVLGELKSKEKACTDISTGIINHFEDMSFFKNEFNNNYEFKIRILDDIAFALFMKRELGFIDFEIKREELSDTMKEFWMLFKMVKEEAKKTPYVKPSYHKLIEKEYENKKRKGKRVSLGFRIYEIIDKIDTQKAYYVTDNFEFKEI